MKQVPYHGNPGGSACALACYTMVAQYLLPDENITFEQLGDIADWREGYVVWGFPVWQWMMDRGISIRNFDASDAAGWAAGGVAALMSSVSEKEFNYYQTNTYDLELVTQQLKTIIQNPNINFVQKSVSWQDVLNEYRKSGICDITLDGHHLHGVEGFSVHRVVLVDITSSEVVFHDPRKDNKGAYSHKKIAQFREAMERLEGVELTRYYRD